MTSQLEVHQPPRPKKKQLVSALIEVYGGLASRARSLYSKTIQREPQGEGNANIIQLSAESQKVKYLDELRWLTKSSGGTQH